MQLTTCMLTFLFLLSVKGAQVAKARVRFAQTTYTVMESSTICMEVINESPIPTIFSVDFTFSGVLLGIEGAADTRSSSVVFNEMDTIAMACIDTRTEDSTPCEADIRGTITLKNNSAVSVINPLTATVIIRDNDAISATFGQSMYLVNEGAGDINLFPFVNSSLPGVAHLREFDRTTYANDKLQRSIFILDSVLNSPRLSQPLSGIIRDDDIALEDAEYVSLELVVNAQQNCMLSLSPHNSTTIIISDDDDVDVKITRSTFTAKEGEDYRLCVSTSKMIARDLVLNMKLTTDTADLDIEQTSNMFQMVLPAFDYDLMECTDIPIVQDNIVESDEQFSVQIMSSESVPASVRNHLHINPRPSVVTILDTSTCIEHTVGSDVANMSDLYVIGNRTLCITCQSCQSSEISWRVTSFEGKVWTGLTGGRLHSRNNLTDQGVVYENGTLLITNSSKLFSKGKAGNITFTETDSPSLSKTFRIILGDGATVISLNLSVEGNASYKIVCQFRGNPQPTVEWIIGNNPVATQNRIETVAKEDHFISTLTLRDVKTTQYACKVTNIFGEDILEGFIFLPTTHSSSKNLMTSFTVYIFSVLLLFCL